MITAKEFINNYCLDDGSVNNEAAEKMLIDFAKLYVIEALKQASEKAFTKLEYLYENDCPDYTNSYEIVDKNSILNAYDLNNIK